MEFTGAISREGSRVAALQGGVMTIIITLCFSVLGIGREEGREEGRKGAFTAMLDTRTRGVGTEDGNNSGSWVGWDGSYIHTPALAPLKHNKQHTHTHARATDVDS